MTLTSLELHTASKRLVAAWDGAAPAALPFALLRSRCPCAECRQHRRGPGEERAMPPTDIVAVVPCGPNAIQLRFSDGHERGIFPFAFLRELAEEMARAEAPQA